MRKITWIVAMVMCVAVFLIGCGKKDATDVVGDLDKAINKLESYQGIGTMTLHTGQQPLEYSVEVWYQSPHFYRIALTNAKKDATQIVLKNDEGVFVLTPSLNKSFRFQSDWPEKHGQPYLYHTLVQSILEDKDRQFTTEGKDYVFDVASNLQHNSLVRQRIWLDQKDYAPKRVEATDAEANVLLEVKFNSFAFDKKFEKNSFDMKHNMTSYDLQSVPTMADDGDATAAAAANTEANTASQGSFGIIKPEYLPKGVIQNDMSEIQLGEDKGILLRYGGDYTFTIVESRPTERAVSATSGTVVNLGYTLGVLLGDEKKTLTWMYEGVEYRLSSGDLPEDEMIQIAQSMESQTGK
jgi:outer membrane lipoprotein-sorting protein